MLTVRMFGVPLPRTLNVKLEVRLYLDFSLVNDIYFDSIDQRKNIELSR